MEMMKSEGWEAVQRQGHAITEHFGGLAQGLGCMLQSHIRTSTPFSSLAPIMEFTSQQLRLNQEFHWPWFLSLPLSKTSSTVDWIIFDIRQSKCYSQSRRFVSGTSFGVFEAINRLGHFGVDLKSRLEQLAVHFAKQISHIHLADEFENRAVLAETLEYASTTDRNLGMEFLIGENIADVGVANAIVEEEDGGVGSIDDEGIGLILSRASNAESSASFSTPPRCLRRQSIVSMATTFDSRTQDIESSFVASGELWRVEASHGSPRTMNGTSPLLLVQLGPILLVRDTTLLLPVHLSKQHLLWYGYDRKNGLHSLCPAIWSRKRKWLCMSMFCLNHISCSFMDLQFPNGQLTYVAGEGLAGSAFLPLSGGLLQAHVRHPGETSLSFSCKDKWGTKWIPAVALPEKSVSLHFIQTLAHRRSGMILWPTVQLSITPTYGGAGTGWRVELIHSPKEKVSWTFGCALTSEPCAFATTAVGRSKCNGEHIGNAGLVLRLETPLYDFRRASFSIRLNSGIEF